jgi:ATP-dependent Clp protease ATP-binding subunit ClpB
LVRESLKEFFRPEFINRIDEIVIFDRLDASQLDKIVLIQLQCVIERLAKQNITLTISDEVIRKPADEGYDPVFSTRPLKRAIQNLLPNPPSFEVLDGNFKDSVTIEAVMKAGKVAFDKA